MADTASTTQGESAQKPVTRQVDVVIVGAGLVGSALACALTQRSDIKVAVLDAQSPPAPYPPDRFDPRVVALSAASVRWLRDLDVWRGIEHQRLCPYRGMEVWDGEGNGRIQFSSDDLHRDELGFIVENSVVRHALHQVMQPRVTYLAPLAVAAWAWVLLGVPLMAVLVIGGLRASRQRSEPKLVGVAQWFAIGLAMGVVLLEAPRLIL